MRLTSRSRVDGLIYIVPLTAAVRRSILLSARCCSTFLPEGFEATTHCGTENDHCRQEPGLSEREQIDEEGGRVVALCASAPS